MLEIKEEDCHVCVEIRTLYNHVNTYGTMPRSFFIRFPDRSQRRMKKKRNRLLVTVSLYACYEKQRRVIHLLCVA